MGRSSRLMSAGPTVLLLLLWTSTSAPAFYGGKAAEAILTFAGVADVPVANVTLRTLNEAGRFRTEALSQIDGQIQHLMGTFQSESFFKDVRSKGVIGETYEVRFTSIEEGSTRGRKRLTYAFEGKAVFQKELFGSDRKANIPIKLPFAPDLIYKQSFDADRAVNPCTDDHYNSEGDFWYFWDPEQRGCGLRHDTERVYRTTGHLERVDKLQRPTYPEYDRLFGDNGNGEVFDVAVFLGYIEEPTESLRRPNRRDDAFAAMQLVDGYLQDDGFKITANMSGFRETKTGQRREGGGVLKRYEKRVPVPFERDSKVTVRVQVLLADTSLDADARPERPDFTFHRYLIPAFQNADVLLYDGHSGLGSNLNLKKLPRFRFKKEKYQVFYFNGCSTYPYYNGAFFEAHGGPRNLEVITSGLPTLSSTSAPNVLAFLKRFLDGRHVTYQTIMRELEDSNEDADTYLAAVNGDQDNRWSPGKASVDHR